LNRSASARTSSLVDAVVTILLPIPSSFLLPPRRRRRRRRLQRLCDRFRQPQPAAGGPARECVPGWILPGDAPPGERLGLHRAFLHDGLRAVRLAGQLLPLLRRLLADAQTVALANADDDHLIPDLERPVDPGRAVLSWVMVRHRQHFPAIGVVL